MKPEEPKKEIQMHMEVQPARPKIGAGERHKAATELREREMKTNAPKGKVEILAKSMAFGDGGDEDGGERSRALYITKATQRHGELQREAKELDFKTRMYLVYTCVNATDMCLVCSRANATGIRPAPSGTIAIGKGTLPLGHHGQGKRQGRPPRAFAKQDAQPALQPARAPHERPSRCGPGTSTPPSADGPQEKQSPPPPPTQKFSARTTACPPSQAPAPRTKLPGQVTRVGPW